ncbi:MAG: DUF6259 domain-containing protein [Tannerella sp.]|nr:DUF6259 domain-containing protein [Tannerella sp.]
MRRISIYVLLSGLTFLWISCTESSELVYENTFYRLALDRRSGSIRSLVKDGQNLVDTASVAGSLFTIRLRSRAEAGKLYEYPARTAARIGVTARGDTIRMTYAGFETEGLEARVTVVVDDDSPLMQWHVTVDNQTPYTLENIDFPCVSVRNDLVATGGEGRIFWPGMEGCVVEDVRVRSEGWVEYRGITYPYMGWKGIYPAATQMQYMAYYNAGGGLYLAAHDEQCTPKGIEFYPAGENAIRLEFTAFTSGAQGSYTLPYPMVLGVFDGDWYDASRIYRDWREASAMPLPPKIADNPRLPAWYTESPVVVTYPVRGHRDLGDMTPNEFYPYTRALKHIDAYREAFGAPVMALLMHWEGSAPWSPPYVWPPYGGTDNYLQFVERLHAKGNLAGLYASGTGYTLRSNTDTAYSRYDEYREKELHRVMKVAPDGAVAADGVCAGPHAQRLGHDMCPANAFAGDAVVDQITRIVASGTDYIQYFDQNLGGNCYACYGVEHGHPYGPGAWQNEAMKAIYERILPVLEAAAGKPLVGCEAAAAEGFIPWLLFNDNRAMINLFVGTPVPAYAFVYHEYVNNFMGNQNAVSVAIDTEKSPRNLLQRLAYSFCAGDMLTVVLRGDGQMIWDWGCPWEAPTPNQQETVDLIRHLTAWRRGAAKEFLVYGKMQKPLPFAGACDQPLYTKKSGYPVHFGSVFTSHWELDGGRHGQLFVNYLPQEQEITLQAGRLPNARIHCAASDAEGQPFDGDGSVKIAPLEAVLITF